MKDYLACVESVDDSVGKLLDYLDESGLAENTIVVYTSDQGFYLGEHGWFDKRFMYEESLRTPLVVRWPGVIKAGRRRRPDRVERRFCGDVFGGGRRDACRPTCKAAACCRCCAARRPRIGGRSFYYHFYEDEDADHHVPRSTRA